MANYVPTREEAFTLLTQYNKDVGHLRHALAVEAVMRHFAELLQETDVDKWATIGLAHDLDYEMYPEQHCSKVRELLEPHQWPEEYIRAIQSHGWKLCSDVKPEHPMEIVLYTIDELTGLIAATALMRPSKSILDLTTKSVMKKWKDKSFAAGVSRDVIKEGASMMGMELERVMDETIKGMQHVAASIGLRGEA